MCITCLAGVNYLPGWCVSPTIWLVCITYLPIKGVRINCVPAPGLRAGAAYF
jgi:hypothetical protein